MWLIQAETATPPMCNICGRPVEDVIISRENGIVYFTALCHGSSDVVEFSESKLEKIKDLRYGTAFTGSGVFL